MGLESMVSSAMKVIKPNLVECKPGGYYNLNEDHEIEARVVRLHLLRHFIDMASEELCANGECRILMGTRMESLADDLFEMYRPFIEAGVNIFEYDEFYDRAKLEKYGKRPVVCGQMNATAEESTEGMPVGWWWDFPGFAKKYFEMGKIVIDVDQFTRICLYNHNDDDNETVIDWIDITKYEDYGLIFKKWPGHAVEIAAAAQFVWNFYQDQQ